jgi:gliding motility-associated-like protein
LTDGAQVQLILNTDYICATVASVTSNSIAIEVNPTVTPSVFISSANLNACEGEEISFNANINNQGNSPVVQWFVNGTLQNTGTTFSSSNLNNGDIVFANLTNNEECAVPNQVTSNNLSVSINPILNPQISIAALNEPVCEGTVISFNSNVSEAGNVPQITWLINGNIATNNSSTFTSNSLKGGDLISAILTTSELCATSNTVASNSILVNALPDLNAIAKYSIFQGESVTLFAESATATSWEWNPPQNLSSTTIPNPIASPEITTTYIVTAITEEGCENNQEVLVEVNRNIVIYTSFTPNDDGINDTWIIDNIEDYPNCVVEIYTRWGMLIHESTGYKIPWDGTYNGEQMPFGSYFYIIDLKDDRSKYQGTVTILK